MSVMQSKALAKAAVSAMVLLLALPVCFACALSHNASFAEDGNDKALESPDSDYEINHNGSAALGEETVCNGVLSNMLAMSDDGRGLLTQRGQVYPKGWLVGELEGMPSGTVVDILDLPGMEPDSRDDGGSADDVAFNRGDDQTSSSANATIEIEGRSYRLDPSYLLINLPDYLPRISYDIVYSYSATSNCSGIDIPTVTGEHLEGYTFGKQPNYYLGREEYIVPCAYATAKKVMMAADNLEQDGYTLLVYDAYRPMRAQDQLSRSFFQAYETDAMVRQSMGEWSLDWYVASGPSGHNYGTDIDVGLCDKEGRVIDMPSEFDAFDERGHLVDRPIAASEIQRDLYRASVRDNKACLALHEAFVEAGFTELASEWWHFGDQETEAKLRALVGDGGLDFTAEMHDE